MWKAWDSSNATFLQRQRFRLSTHVINQGRRNDVHENAYLSWRSRNTDFWSDRSDNSRDCDASSRQDPDPSAEPDPEALGFLTDDAALIDWAQNVIDKNAGRRKALRRIRERFWKMFEPESGSQTEHGLNDVTLHEPAVFDNPSIHLATMARSIQSLQREQDNTEYHGAASSNDLPGRGDREAEMPVGAQQPGLMAPTFLTHDQYVIAKGILTGIDEGKQTMTMLHGGGGTGKSFLIRTNSGN